MESLQSAFQSAVQFLRDENWQEACDAFEKISNESGKTSSALEENLAKCHFNLGHQFQSLDHMNRATFLARFDGELRFRNQALQAKTSSAMATSDNSLQEWAFSGYRFLRPYEAMSFASLFGLILLFVLQIRRLQSRQWLKAGLLVVTVLFASWSLFVRQATKINLVKTAVAVKNVPLESAEELIKLLPGTRVNKLRESGDFADVERAGAFRGWIKKDALQPLIN